MKHLFPFTFFVLAAGACGNYSNEDLEFQLALPGKGDLAAKLPGQALTAAESAEYHRSTRDVVGFFNAIQDGFFGIIDHLRRDPATTRERDERSWGPVPHERDRNWLVRMVMRRHREGSAGTARYSYDIQLRPAAGGDWIDFVRGHHEPNGGAGKGKGEMTLDTIRARAAGFPVDDPADPDDLNDAESLALTYETVRFPTEVRMSLTNLPRSESPRTTTSYLYRGEKDGAGSMAFSFPFPAPPLVSRIELVSQWTASGAGRGDARVVEGLLTGGKGIDCWGRDSLPTYVHRDFPDPKQPNRGDAATCVVPALAR